MNRASRKRHPPDKPVSQIFDPEILEEVRQLFNKVQDYRRPPEQDWHLPDPGVTLCHPAWTHPPLQALKKSLNEVKNELSDKDLEVWHQHTCSTNRAGTITGHLRQTTNAELCTQAWAKFYEILGTFQVLPEGALMDDEMTSVHLCEAPGAFVSALNHFLRATETYCDWNWVANTLNPYHEANGRGCTITDDRLIANTLKRWFFGSDDTGDIMIQKHLLELRQFVGDLHGVDLVTADGSFDCQGDPGEQEHMVAPLQYCETVSALLLLGPGGSFVLKMFTLLEDSSVCLLYLLVCCFRTVHVFKPGTSKAGNSEVYIVCLDFNAKEKLRPLLSKLIRNYGPGMCSQVALFPKCCIPQSFLEQHQKICEFFHNLQVATMKENMLFFEGMTSEQRHRLDRIRNYSEQFYVQHFQVQYLPRKRWLCPPGGGSAWNRPKLGPQKQMGSFNDRKEMQLQKWRTHLARGPLRTWVEEHLQILDSDFVLSGPFLGSDLGSWGVLEGSRLPKVCSSIFCDQELLDLLNKAIKERTCPPDGVEPCSLCDVPHPGSILNEICSIPDVPVCLVMVGNPSWRDLSCSGSTLIPRFIAGPSYPEFLASALHDGDPQDQRELLSGLLQGLRDLPKGSALVVPLRSALTRFTASLVLALHLCFRSVSFRCPLGAPPAVLLCLGFCPVPRVHAILQNVVDGVHGVAMDRQVLQFAPMEDLIRGELTDFLFSLNNAVIRRQLHLRLHREPDG